MNEKKRLKYEKPVSIDMGRVAPILGLRCSSGGIATDGCAPGAEPQTVSACNPTGSGAVNNCQTGGSAGGFCLGQGSSAGVGCYAGDGN